MRSIHFCVSKDLVWVDYKVQLTTQCKQNAALIREGHWRFETISWRWYITISHCIRHCAKRRMFRGLQHHAARRAKDLKSFHAPQFNTILFDINSAFAAENFEPVLPTLLNLWAIHFCKLTFRWENESWNISQRKIWTGVIISLSYPRASWACSSWERNATWEKYIA